MEPLPLIIGLLVVGALAYFGWHQGIKRREALHAWATSMGLTYSHHDNLGISAAHPFQLWAAGDERKWDNVIQGTLDGQPVLLFDFEFTEVTRTPQGKTQRTTRKFTCAVADLPGAFTPGLQLQADGMFSDVNDLLGGADLALESDAFNRRFEVGARERKFAAAFLDTPMMNWLMTTPSELQLEVLGNHVLVAGPVLEQTSWLGRHQIATDFANHCPDVIRSLYPA
ncbi:MAG: hypothetical protein ACI867_002191 [Glaciecola sp.]|jgi:hypothetical protein